MRKLKLDVETLAVESFDTAHEESAGRGTVHGQSGIPFTYIPSPLCPATFYGAWCAQYPPIVV
jgi:hypothetical protein